MGRLSDAISARATLGQPAVLVSGKTAGVAVVIRDGDDGEEVLLIKRAEREGDPWSGQVAFPGGMANGADKTFEETARREAREEVGADLSDAEFLGYLSPRKTHTRNVLVVPSVFETSGLGGLATSREVALYFWAPLEELANERSPSGGKDPPQIVHEGLVIWGLTERILSELLAAGEGR